MCKYYHHLAVLSTYKITFTLKGLSLLFFHRFHSKCIQNKHNNTHWTTLSCNGRSCSTINYHSSAFNVHSGLPSVGKLDKVAHQAFSCRAFTRRYHCSNQSKISHKFTAGNGMIAEAMHSGPFQEFRWCFFFAWDGPEWWAECPGCFLPWQHRAGNNYGV